MNSIPGIVGIYPPVWGAFVCHRAVQAYQMPCPTTNARQCDSGMARRRDYLHRLAIPCTRLGGPAVYLVVEGLKDARFFRPRCHRLPPVRKSVMHLTIRPKELHGSCSLLI